MPCSCKIPMPDFPTNCDWGPIIWRLLHGVAEKYGKLMSPLFAIEEQIAWIKLLNETEKILPCKECKAHYKEYVRLHNPDILKTMPNNDRGLWIQRFFFNLHNEINVRNNIPLFEFENLSITYKNVNYNYNIKNYEKLLKIIFTYNEVGIVSWKSWLRHFSQLLSIYGLS